MKFEIYSMRERPDLLREVFAAEFQSLWPEFMNYSDAAKLYFSPWIFDHYLDYAFAGVLNGAVVARAFSVPFVYEGPGRYELPDGGWDRIINWALEDKMMGRRPNALSALEITLLPVARGKGYSAEILNAMKRLAKQKGLSHLFVPLRPTQAGLQSNATFFGYINSVRDDGLPVDPWLRGHVKLGGEVIKIAPYSMTIIGSLADWRKWTGEPFNKDGEQLVQGALTPVHVSLERGFAVYVEPNIWIRHRLV